MKKQFIKFLPLMAAMILTASCGNNDKDPVTPQPSPEKDTPAQTTGEETVTVPFTIKVSNGNKLTKEADLNQTIFNSEDVGTKSMTVTSATNSDVTGTLNLCYDVNNGYYYFDGEISCDKENIEDLTGGKIQLTGTYGTALEAPMYASSYNELLSICNRLFKSDFVFNSTELTLTDQNTYLEITMSKTQFTLDVTSDGKTTECALNEDGQVWVAVSSGKKLQVGTFLSKEASDVEPSKKHSINRSNLVDVGIEGILWADHNVGGENPWDWGDYFAWGEIEPYYKEGNAYLNGVDENHYPIEGFWKDGKGNGYDWLSYRYADSWDNIKKYCTKPLPDDYTWSGEGTEPDGKLVLDQSDDVAYAKDANHKLSMPTTEDFTSLRNSCYWVWTKNYAESGKSGYIIYKALYDADKGIVTSEQKVKDGYTITDVSHIFLPAAGYRGGASLHGPGEGGYYWSSSLYTGDPSSAHRLYFFSDFVDPLDIIDRYYGYPVRAVRRSSGL